MPFKKNPLHKKIITFLRRHPKASYATVDHELGQRCQFHIAELKAAGILRQRIEKEWIVTDGK